MAEQIRVLLWERIKAVDYYYNEVSVKQQQSNWAIHYRDNYWVSFTVRQRRGKGMWRGILGLRREGLAASLNNLIKMCKADSNVFKDI